MGEQEADNVVSIGRSCSGIRVASSLLAKTGRVCVQTWVQLLLLLLSGTLLLPVPAAVQCQFVEFVPERGGTKQCNERNSSTSPTLHPDTVRRESTYCLRQVNFRLPLPSVPPMVPPSLISAPCCLMLCRCRRIGSGSGVPN